MLLTDKYADKIHGIITCYDRMIIQGYIPNWSHAEAMTAYMKLNGIRIVDYPTSFSQPLTEQVRQNAEKIAHENGFLTGCRTTRSLKSPILKLLRNFLTVSTRKGSIKFSMSLPDATVPFRNLSGWGIPGRFSRSNVPRISCSVSRNTWHQSMMKSSTLRYIL